MDGTVIWTRREDGRGLRTIPPGTGRATATGATAWGGGGVGLVALATAGVAALGAVGLTGAGALDRDGAQAQQVAQEEAPGVEDLVLPESGGDDGRGGPGFPAC